MTRFLCLVALSFKAINTRVRTNYVVIIPDSVLACFVSRSDMSNGDMLCRLLHKARTCVTYNDFTLKIYDRVLVISNSLKHC